MLLDVKNLTIEFHDHLIPETVVDDVSFCMEEGEMLGIVGESGSGKSMTALAIAGLLPRKEMKKSGEIIFDNKELLTLKRSELRNYQGNEISVIFQEPMTALNPSMKVGKQIEETLRVHTDMNKAERKAKALDIIERVELPEPQRIYESFPHELSGGQRQRVMIAAACISNPRLLIADEPTTALDVTVQMQILKLLRRINEKRNMAILFISHDLGLVKQLCDRVLVMHDGKVVEQGKTTDIFENPQDEYTKGLISAIPRIDMDND